MAGPQSDALPGSESLRRSLYTVGLVVLFRFLFDFTWAQVLVLVGLLLVSESVEIGRELPGLDERHARLVLAVVVVAASGSVYWRGADPVMAVIAAAVGGWLALDAVYSLHAGIRANEGDGEDPTAKDLMLSMQVGHLVAEELKTGPKTVAELAEACDMTESRVRDALEFHERAGTVYRDGDRWVLDESRIGLWAFVRDNTRRLVARFVRPFRLFVPS